MKIQADRLALASALIAAILYAVCWMIVAVVPGIAMSVTEDMFHMHLDSVEWKMTAGSLLVGTLAGAAATGAAVWLVGILYNRIRRTAGDLPSSLDHQGQVDA